MRYTKTLAGVVIIIVFALVPGHCLVSSTAQVGDQVQERHGAAANGSTQHFYGVQYVPLDELGLVSGLGVDVVLMQFDHDGPVESWLAYLDEAHDQGIGIVAWLWPQGWHWDGSEWQIDAQAELFVQTMAGHPALVAVYALHEPYWNGCVGCGYTTAEQQALYTAIKAIADVPLYSGVNSVSYWTEYSEATAFADGVCDYCAMWHHPFKEGGIYERDQVITQLQADRTVIRQRAPNSKMVWIMQAFAQGAPYNLRMPTADEMRDLSSIVCSAGIDGALWYTWTFNESYTDFLANHPELQPVVEETSERWSGRYAYLPMIMRRFSD